MSNRTAEEHLRNAGIDLGWIIEVMESYAAEQNAELRKEYDLFKKNTAFREGLAIEARDRRDNEIEELRKEVEELRSQLTDERANGRIEWERFRMQDKDEITRLRELLERSGDLHRQSKVYLVKYGVLDTYRIDELLTEIEQTLKP